METMASIIIFSAALFAGLQRDQLGAGLVGMSVSYALQVGSHTILCQVHIHFAMADGNDLILNKCNLEAIS